MSAPRARVVRRPVHGVLVLDKSRGISSNNALQKAKWLLRAEKAGHTGTLDPLASGVLVIAFGEATKLVDHVMDGAKRYAFEVAWGEERGTDDLEGEVTARSDMRPDREAILAAGGANFPGKPPWEGGTKVFHRDIFLCRRDAAGKWSWTKVGDLPGPNAYAAFCASPDRKALIIAGGADAEKHLDAVWKVGADGRCEKFAAPLPEPRAYAGFAEVNGALAVLGGSRSPDATAALGTLASLRLDQPQAGWRISAEEAAQARILPLFGADETTLLWGGGCGLFAQGGKPARAYQSDLQHANSRLQGADFHGLPAPLAAPAGPGVASGTGLFFVGGDDGGHYGKPPADHPGWPSSTSVSRPTGPPSGRSRPQPLP